MWTHSSRKYWSQTTHTHRLFIRRIQSLKRKQTSTGSGIWTSVHVELCFHILCFYQLGCGPVQAFSEDREHCPWTALYCLAMPEWKKNQTTRKKYLYIQHLLVSAMCETDMENGNCCHESELAAVWGSGGESHTSGGKRSHRRMITLPCIPFFSLTQGRVMRKIKLYFIHGWIQMLASTLAPGGRKRTTDTETWLKLSKSDPHLGLQPWNRAAIGPEPLWTCIIF